MKRVCRFRSLKSKYKQVTYFMHQKDSSSTSCCVNCSVACNCQVTMFVYAAVPPSSKVGQALPEDIFAMPPAAEQTIRVQAGYSGALPRGSAPAGQQNFFNSTQNFSSSPAGSPMTRGGMNDFQAFTSASAPKASHPLTCPVVFVQACMWQLEVLILCAACTAPKNSCGTDVVCQL